MASALVVPVNTASWGGHALVAFSVAAILAPFSYYMGLAARSLKLPQITGYLISGIMCGPYLLGILSSESVQDLNIIEGACLSIIGLAAGAEIHLSELSRSKKQVSKAEPCL
jgi:Kef-type K+ transport system membrane component KefB